MKSLFQRVSSAAVRVDGHVVGEIARGALLLVGVEEGDTDADAEATATKVAQLRVFPGRTPMDESLLDIRGAVLVVSQFTLAGSIRKGNRPSFTAAAAPEEAKRLYLLVEQRLRKRGLQTATGSFGADMSVSLVNEGPATFRIETCMGKIL